MDGLFQEGFCNGLCWFIPQSAPEPAQNYRPTPRGYQGQIPSPQDPLPSAAVTHSLEQTQRLYRFYCAFHKALPEPAQELSPYPPKPHQGSGGQIPITTKPVPTVGIPTGAR
jgi:hypothetical protein